MAWWFEVLGQTKEALHGYQEVTESNEFARAKLKLAYLHKKDKEWNHAVALFEEVIQLNQTELNMEAGIELAKIYEHHLKKYGKALDYTNLSYVCWKQALFKQKKQTQADFLKRIHRLEKKIAAL